jgi:hypothetical protein
MSNAGDSSRRAKRPAKNTPTGNYEVGFCKPPRANQFKPANNANPMGRPKGMRNRKVVVKALLLAINDALKGDHKSRLMAIAMAREDGLLTPEQVEAIEENMSEHDKKIMENFKTRFAPQSALQTKEPIQSHNVSAGQNSNSTYGQTQTTPLSQSNPASGHATRR